MRYGICYCKRTSASCLGLSPSFGFNSGGSGLLGVGLLFSFCLLGDEFLIGSI